MIARLGAGLQCQSGREVADSRHGRWLGWTQFFPTPASFCFIRPKLVSLDYLSTIFMELHLSCPIHVPLNHLELRVDMIT